MGGANAGWGVVSAGGGAKQGPAHPQGKSGSARPKGPSSGGGFANGGSAGGGGEAWLSQTPPTVPRPLS